MPRRSRSWSGKTAWTGSAADWRQCGRLISPIPASARCWQHERHGSWRASAPWIQSTGDPVAVSASREAASMTTNSPEEAEFDYCQPFEVDIGRAAVIAEWLRENGYP